MNTFKFPESKFKVIMNKFGREGTITTAEEVRSFLKKDVSILPYAPDDAVITSNGGRLLLSEKSASPLTQAMVNLNRQIVGEELVAESGGIFSKLKSILGF